MNKFVCVVALAVGCAACRSVAIRVPVVDRTTGKAVFVEAHFRTNGDLPQLEGGIGWAQRGEWVKAEEIFRRAIAEGGRNPTVLSRSLGAAYYDLGLAYEYGGQLGNARRYLGKAWDFTQDQEILAELAHLPDVPPEEDAHVATEVALAQPAPRAAPAALPMPQAAPATRAAQPQKRLAVLELKSSATELSPANIRYIADLVREEAVQIAPSYGVMTRENLLTLLEASGKDLASCEGECEIDTGRRIGADAIVSGDVQRFGTRFKVSLRLYETLGGTLLAAQTASATKVDELDDNLRPAARQLLRALH